MKINSKFEKMLTFSLLMENVQDKPEINFVIDAGEIKMSFPCSILEDSTIQVQIPKLCEYRNILIKDKYPAYIEAIVGESYKKPWKTSVIIETPSTIIVQPKEIIQDPEGMTIKINDIQETKIIKGCIEPDELVKLSKQTEDELETPLLDALEKKSEPKRNIFKEFINK